jgi:uncharacterized alpha-E superfamily protein
MSEDPSKEKLLELLNLLYANIVQYAKEDMLPTAEKAFYSTRDYALGDTISCSADAALENCEQIRGCFPGTTPQSVFESVDKVKKEIARQEEKSKPRFLRSFWFLILVAAVAFFIYFLLTHK